MATESYTVTVSTAKVRAELGNPFHRVEGKQVELAGQARTRNEPAVAMAAVSENYSNGIEEARS